LCTAERFCRTCEAARIVLGLSSAESTPVRDSMLKDASRRKFDIIMAWTIDRLGRLLRGFQQIVRQLLS
jgi:DNA invertase Pin-like site-specific DNA recombinase